jgi:hypothetical protein
MEVLLGLGIILFWSSFIYGVYSCFRDSYKYIKKNGFIEYVKFIVVFMFIVAVLFKICKDVGSPGKIPVSRSHRIMRTI